VLRQSGYWASLSMARLPRRHRPHIRFLFVESEFCLRLPSDPASRRRPCLQLTVPTTTACKGLDFDWAQSKPLLIDPRHAWRTKKGSAISGPALVFDNRMLFYLLDFFLNVGVVLDEIF